MDQANDVARSFGIAVRTGGRSYGQPARRLGYKRPMDIMVGSVLAFVSAPLFGLIALVVKLSSPGPVLFRQERVGLNGSRFIIYKFRTMYVNADSHSHREYFKQYMKGTPAPGQPGNLFKLRRDSRITPFGGILRRLGLDELPQLINVIKGDMTLVGPRPPLDYEVERYEDHHLRRLSVKPGVTGLWQIRGRDLVDFESMVDMDLEYIDHQSFLYDVRLLLMTVPSLVWAFIRH